MPVNQSYLPALGTQQARGHSQDSSSPSASLLVLSSCRTGSAPPGSALPVPAPGKVSAQPSHWGRLQTGRRLLYQVLSPAPVPGTCSCLHDYTSLWLLCSAGAAWVTQKPWPVTEVKILPLWGAGMPAIWADLRHGQKHGLATAWSCSISSWIWVWTQQFKSWQSDKPNDSCFFLNHSTFHPSTCSEKVCWQGAALDTGVLSDTNWDVSCSHRVI